MHRLYLICDRRDEPSVEALEDFFFEQGIEVSLPEFEQNETEVNKIHWQNLQDCDAVLIYYGAGGKSWVDIKLRDLMKAAGYRDGNPIAHQLVYVAPVAFAALAWHARRSPRRAALGLLVAWGLALGVAA